MSRGSWQGGSSGCWWCRHASIARSTYAYGHGTAGVAADARALQLCVDKKALPLHVYTGTVYAYITHAYTYVHSTIVHVTTYVYVHVYAHVHVRIRVRARVSTSCTVPRDSTRACTCAQPVAT